MQISVKQIKAARVLLEWTQINLAEHAKVNKDTIANLEAYRTSPNRETLDKILGTLEMAGIEFVEHGVRIPAVKSIILDKQSPDWFVNFLDDIIFTLKQEADPNLIIYGANDKLTKPEAIEKFRQLRNMGVQMRSFIKEGDSFIRGKECEYRYIPAELFLNYNTYVYGSKVCHDTDKNFLILINEELANSERNKLDVLWQKCSKVNVESTADVRY